MNVKQGERIILLFLKINLSTVIETKRSRGELSIEKVIRIGIFKNNQFTLSPCFTLIPKTGVSFYCVYYHRKNVPLQPPGLQCVAVAYLTARHRPITCLIARLGRQPQRTNVQVVAGGCVFFLFMIVLKFLLKDQECSSL